MPLKNFKIPAHLIFFKIEEGFMPQIFADLRPNAS